MTSGHKSEQYCQCARGGCFSCWLDPGCMVSCTLHVRSGDVGNKKSSEGWDFRGSPGNLGRCTASHIGLPWACGSFGSLGVWEKWDASVVSGQWSVVTGQWLLVGGHWSVVSACGQLGWLVGPLPQVNECPVDPIRPAAAKVQTWENATTHIHFFFSWRGEKGDERREISSILLEDRARHACHICHIHRSATA